MSARPATGTGAGAGAGAGAGTEARTEARTGTGRGTETAPRVVLVGSKEAGGALEGYALELLGERLALLGARVVGPEATARFEPAAFPGRRLELELEPAAAARAKTPVALRVALAGAPPLELSGRAGEIDRLLNEAATALSTSTVSEAALADRVLPFSVHRMLARASARERAGARPQARILYERAIDRGPGALSVRALLAARRLRGASLRPGLVAAALERLDDAERRREASSALDAALDAVRYGARARLRWRFDLPSGARRIWVSDRDLEVAAPAAGGAATWLRIAAPTGTLIERGRAPALPFGAVNDDLLLRAPGTILRFVRSGERRWSTALPKGLGAAAALSGGGQIALSGPRGVGWLESSLGRPGQVADGARPLAVQEAGALVALGRGEVRLLRPGRSAPAWSSTVAGSIRQAGLTGARALLVTSDALHLLDAHDGRRVGRPLPLPPRARLLAAHGRHAAIGLGGGRVGFFDVLAGAQVAEVEGPERPVDAHVGAFSIAVLFRGGALASWDFDGIYLDRARVEGRPLGIHRAPATSPGPIVETESALLSFDEVVPGARYDVDVLLAAARAARASDRARDARVLVTEVARRSAGRIPEAERLRAELLEAEARGGADPSARARARAARARARAAADPSAPLPPFSL